MNKAFTLIELLVVVLIVGILAALALPKYNKAVEKSRAVEAVILGKAIVNSLDRFYLLDGAWPAAFDPEYLDISLPPNASFSDGTVTSGRFSYSYSTLGNGREVLVVSGPGYWFDIYSFAKSNGIIHCCAGAGDAGEGICKAM